MMTTLKQILMQICLRDWLFSLDLKDAYVHIQIAPHDRQFLKFAFEGVAFQITVLLLDCPWLQVHGCGSLPMRQREIRILNYLDDWLILA